MSFHASRVAAAAALAALTACADVSTGPSSLTAAGPVLTLVPHPVTIVPAGQAVLMEEKLLVCKTFTGGTSYPAASFDATLDFVDPLRADAAASFSLNDGECADFGFFGGAGVNVTVSETPISNYSTSWTTTLYLVTTGVQPTSAPTAGYVATGSAFGTRTGFVATGTRIDFVNAFIPPPEGCSYTIGFWKTHAGFNGNNDDVVTGLLPIWLGTSGGAKSVQVTTASQAVAILEMTGGASNGVVKLYAQLLGAKLSIANGSNGAAVAATIAAADAWLATHDAGSWSGLSRSQKNMVLGWMTTLDNYNNGLIGPGHCY